MNIIHLSVNRSYEMPPARFGGIGPIIYGEVKEDLTENLPVLLPKEERCCDMATD